MSLNCPSSLVLGWAIRPVQRLQDGAFHSPSKPYSIEPWFSTVLPCRQQAIDNLNMLLQDPRPLEEKRDELAQVGYCRVPITMIVNYGKVLLDRAASLLSCEWKACA